MADRTSLPQALAVASGALLGVFAAAALARKMMSNFPLAHGVCLTLYSPGGSLASAWARGRESVEYVQPEIVQLHAHYQGTRGIADVAKAIRATIPNVRLWLGVATDPAIENGAAGAIQTGKVAVDEAGVECVVWNAEAAFKTNPKSTGSTRAREILDGFRRLYPNVVQGHTAYPQPTVHSSYPWSAWLGGHDTTGTFSKGADFSLPQVYGFSGTQDPGPSQTQAFLHSYPRHKTSWATAIRTGLILDVPLGVYLPGEHVLWSALEDVGRDFPVQCFWPWRDRPPSGFDLDAMTAAIELTGHGP